MYADTSCMEEEATAPAEDSEPFIPFDPDACFNEGQPLKLEWDGTYENIVDGFGLCSLLGGSLRLGASVLAIGP